MKNKIQNLMVVAVLIGAGAGSSAFSSKRIFSNTFQVTKRAGLYYHYYEVGGVPFGIQCLTIGESCTISTNLTLARLNNASPPIGTNYTTTFPTTAEADRLSPGSIFQ